MNKRATGWGLALVFFFVSPVLATSIEPLNLVDLTQRSYRIFEGRVLGIEHITVKSKGGKLDIPAVRYTFEVLDAIKGVGGATLTIQQFGRAQDGKEFFVKPEYLMIPEYQVGETYLLFMYKDGSTGLTSPIGLIQGVFKVKEGLAQNNVSNAQILYGMQDALKTTAYAPLWTESVKQLRAKSEAGSGIDVQLLKALVRDLIVGSVKAPTLGEVFR